MRYTKFAGGCFEKIVGSLLCVILGIVLTLGGIALGGYILLTRPGMVGTLEDFAQKQNLPVDFGDEYRELTLLKWGEGVLPILLNMMDTPMGQIEEALGLNFISSGISDATGLDLEVVKGSTFSDFGKTFVENLTVEQASANFGITFPDLPAFQREDFLSQPLSTAFSAIDDFELRDFVEITPDSSPILTSLADMKIGEMSDPEKGLDTRINDLPLKDVITIVEEEGENQSNKILIKLKDTKVGELGSPETNDLIMSMKLSEVIDINEETATAVLWELRDTPIGELDSEETDEKIQNMKIADLIEIDEDSSPTLKYFRDNNVTLAGKDPDTQEPNGVNAALKVMKLRDMMTLTDPNEGGSSTKLFWALRDCPIETIPADDMNPEILGIEDTMKILPLHQVLETGDTHIWGYIGNSTIETLGQDIDNMLMSDVIDITEESPAILRKMRVFDADKDTPGNEALFGAENIKVSELDTKLEPLVQGMYLGELITIDETSEPILQALQNTTISGLNAKIAVLKINEVFSEAQYSVGLLSIVDEETPLNSIAGELATAVSIARMQVLINCGIVTGPTLFDKELQTGLHNKSIDEIIEDYAKLLNNPSANSELVPERHYLDPTDDYIDMAFLDNLPNFDDGDTLVLGADTIIPAEDFTKIFNIMTNGYTLTIEDGATIRSIYNGKDQGGSIFISNDVYLSSPPWFLPDVQSGGQVVGWFEDPEDIKENYKISVIMWI